MLVKTFYGFNLVSQAETASQTVLKILGIILDGMFSFSEPCQ